MVGYSKVDNNNYERKKDRYIVMAPLYFQLGKMGRPLGRPRALALNLSCHEHQCRVLGKHPYQRRGTCCV